MNQSAPNTEVSLDRLPIGRTAWVVRIDGDDVVAKRLGDLGLWPGTDVRSIRRAPLGDPTQYELRGYRLALRRAEAQRVTVTLVDPQRP